MEKIQLKKRNIWRHGDSYATVVPKQLVDNNIIDIDKQYDITLEESQQNKEKPKNTKEEKT